MPPLLPKEGLPADGEPIDLGEDGTPATNKEDSTEARNAFISQFAGKWTLDPEMSDLAPGTKLELGAPIILEMKKTGSFSASASNVTVSVNHPPVPAFKISADVDLSGDIVVMGPENGDGSRNVQVQGLNVQKRQFKLTGVASLFNFFINPLFDKFVKATPTKGELSLLRDGKHRILQFSSGSIVQRFYQQAPAAHLVNIRFVNDHKLMHAPSGWDTPAGVAKGTSFKDPGVLIKGVHWDASKNLAVSMTQGDVAVIEVSVTVTPAGKQFRLIGSAKNLAADNLNSMSFESGILVSQGMPQSVIIDARSALPKALTLLRSTLDWQIQDVGEGTGAIKFATSGPHRIYTTIAKPFLYSSCNHINNLTEIRLAFAIEALKTLPANDALNIHEIASCVQFRANNYHNGEAPLQHQHPIGLSRPSTLNAKGLADLPDPVWGLLDSDNIEQGNCGEATMLMELMLRLIGIEATQTHVYASSKKPVLSAGENVIYKRLSNELMGAGSEKRYCEHHKLEEELSMIFHPDNPNNFGINVAEGTVKVGDTLYAGLLNVRATDHGGRPASYNLVLAMENQFERNDKGGFCHFQAWTFSTLDKETGAPYPDICNLKDADPKLPGVPVPI